MKRITEFMKFKGTPKTPVYSRSIRDLHMEGWNKLHLKGTRARSGREAGNIPPPTLWEEADSSFSYLHPGSNRPSKDVVEQAFHRAFQQWLGEIEPMFQEQKTTQSLSRQLGKAERKASALEKEVKQLKEILWEKTLALEMAEKKLHVAQMQAEEFYALHLKKDQERENAIRKLKVLRKQLVQGWRDKHVLFQQLGRVPNKVTQEGTTQTFTHGGREEIISTEASGNKQLEKRISALEQKLKRAQSKDEKMALQLAELQAEKQRAEKMATKTLDKNPQERPRRLPRPPRQSLSRTRRPSRKPSYLGEQLQKGFISGQMGLGFQVGLAWAPERAEVFSI
ncbi:ankyrin repeat domain-containing protein 26-like isoform X2 [Heliangelus exortis]|uniref:ankyrin repeat domain-containing protein 26-like isoform X2 n=1 Tax=Heliangelus exortis TaxID=472823 RepID=UPI003A8D0E34